MALGATATRTVRARSAALGYDARTHEDVVGANNTDDWHGHLAEMGVA